MPLGAFRIVGEVRPGRRNTANEQSRDVDAPFGAAPFGAAPFGAVSIARAAAEVCPASALFGLLPLRPLRGAGVPRAAKR